MRKYLLISMMGCLMVCSAAYADLVDNGDGTVTDTQTGLTWQQAEAGSMYWEAALTYCENLELAGYDDWRLPNRNELQSLVDYSKVDPSIDSVAFPDALSSLYWSSTAIAGYSFAAWAVGFHDGGVGYPPTPFSYYVRAVRGGQ